MLERYKSSSNSDDGLLKVLSPLALQYCSEFCQSELLSRKLVYFCSRKLNAICNSVIDINPPQSPTKGASNNSVPRYNSIIQFYHFELNICISGNNEYNAMDMNFVIYVYFLFF